jgi:hypothetical protein
MKKLLYLFSALLLSSGLSAQITIDRTDFPSIGEFFYLLNDSNLSGLTAGSSGNTTWDFTALDIDRVDTIHFIDPSTTNFGSFFPSSNMALSSSTGDFFLKINNDSLTVPGVTIDALGTGDLFPVTFHPELKLFDFPSTYNDNFNMVTVVDTTIDTNLIVIDSARLRLTQTTSAVIDGYGSIALPSGNFSCLRQLTIDTIVQEIWFRNIITGWSAQPNLEIVDTVWTYRWVTNNEGYYLLEANADANGNLLTASFKASSQVLSVLTQQTNPSCKGDCNASATVSGVGGSGSYSYQWDSNAGGGSSASVNSLCAGVYYYTVSDLINGSNDVDSVVVVEPNTISLSAAITLESNLGNDGEIDLTTSGGTPPYNWSWSNSDNVEDINTLVGGDYTVTVTDANGCSYSETFTVGSRVGLEERAERNTFTIAPNPANGFVEVLGQTQLDEILLFDVLGSQMRIQHGLDRRISLDNLPAGIYLIELRSNGESETHRLQVVH